MNVFDYKIKNAQISILMVDDLKIKFPQTLPKNNVNLKRIREKETVATLINLRLKNHQLLYNKNGKPFLEPSTFLSISHSKSIIGIAWSKNYNIGLDIEEIHPRINKVESKFVHHLEKELALDLKSKTIIWCIKEAMIKILDNKTLDFKNELRVSKKDSQIWTCTLLQERGQQMEEFIIFERHNNIICVNTSTK